jgi:F-type H+-transporting ATPase subunit alpha
MQEEGRDVLIVFDDLTKHAWAYRQISLLLERAPGRDAYPGDIFYIHSQLVERAGKLKPELGGGSMTQLPIVETLQSDVAGYIPSNIVSMTDGQIFMSSGLFSEGFKPAIDMGLSVSRIGSKVQWPAMKAMTGMLQLDFVRYKELEKLTRLRAGVSGDVQARLEHGRVLEEVLKQEQNRPMELEIQIIRLYALRQGLFDGVDPVDVRALLDKFVAQVLRDAAGVVADLIKQTRLTDEIKEGLDEQLRRFSHTIVQN